jgi:hypothetical protein
MLLFLVASSETYPRLGTLQLLISAMNHYPPLAKTIGETLVDFGHSIAPTATRDEASALINGTLSQESFVRHSCLQAIQV